MPSSAKWSRPSDKRKQVRLKQIEDSVTPMQQDLEKKFPAARPGRPADQPAESLPGVGPSLAASQVARLREKLDNAEVRAEAARRREEAACPTSARHPETELPPVPSRGSSRSSKAIRRSPASTGRWPRGRSSSTTWST